MANTTLVCIRLPVTLLRRLDRYAKKLSKDTGMNVTRSDAFRSLLLKELKKGKNK